MNYTIEKKRPPKKQKKETLEEERQKKLNDPMYAIFGDYYKVLENQKQS